MSKKFNEVKLTEMSEKLPGWVEELVNISGIKPMAVEMLIMNQVKEAIFHPTGYVIDYCIKHDENPTQEGFETFIRETFNVSAELKIKE